MADRRSECGDFPVFKKNLRRWTMYITAYADKLTDDLDIIGWPERIRFAQRHQIGRSEGANVEFDIPEVGRKLEAYTVRLDTLFGATFMATASEHPILGDDVSGSEADQPRLNIPASWPEGTNPLWTDGAAAPVEAVAEYRVTAAAKNGIERSDDERVKTGVFIGLFGVNPANGRQVPISAADYVLMGYGTDVAMAIPAHDSRDWKLTRAYDLDVVRTIGPAEDPYGPGLEEAAYEGEDIAIDSVNGSISLGGLSKDETKAVMTAWPESTGAGRAIVTHRLRDRLFSHQRYWGESFPIVWGEERRPYAPPEDYSPVGLPGISDYSPRTFDPEDADSLPEPPFGRTEE